MSQVEDRSDTSCRVLSVHFTFFETSLFFILLCRFSPWCRIFSQIIGFEPKLTLCDANLNMCEGRTVSDLKVSEYPNQEDNSDDFLGRRHSCGSRVSDLLPQASFPHHCIIFARQSPSTRLSFLNSLFAGEDSKCEAEIKVLLNTSYHASVGESLHIDCPVKYCDTLTPKVSWYKLEETSNSLVLISVSRSCCINTEWKPWNYLEWISHLIKNVIQSDAGVYRCKTASNTSHNINLYVYGESFLSQSVR